MEVYKLYKHVNTRDTAICPFKVEEFETYIEVTFDVFNVHYNELGAREPFLIYPDYTKGQKPQTVIFTREQLKSWKEYNAEANWGILREDKKA
jgi:hypothetical protein